MEEEELKIKSELEDCLMSLYSVWDRDCMKLDKTKYKELGETIAKVEEFYLKYYEEKLNKEG